MRVSRSGYYAALERDASERSRQDLALRERLAQVHQQYRRAPGIIKTWKLLLAEGMQAGRNRIARLRRLMGIRTPRTQHFDKRRRCQREEPPAENLLRRHFAAGQPGRAWVGDMTAIPTRREGMLHLAAFLDIGTRKIVGWSTGAAQTGALAVTAVEAGLAKHVTKRGMICHTDQGSPFASTVFRTLLSSKGMRASMSRKGNCHDNAAIESFFSTLKNELTHHQMFDDHASAAAAIRDFIEIYYNQQRLHQTLGYRTPAEFEKLHRCA